MKHLDKSSIPLNIFGQKTNIQRTHSTTENLMLKRTSIYLDPKTIRKLSVIGKPEGLKAAQLIRVAIGEFVNRKGVGA